LVAIARWHGSNDNHAGLLRSIISSLGGKATQTVEAKQHVGCIAVKDERLHLFDFGVKPADQPALEGYLFDLVRHGAIPAMVSKPLSSLVIKRSVGFSSKAAVVSGALQLHVFPGTGDDFSGALWSALSPSD
jgi:hypothetical protein